LEAEQAVFYHLRVMIEGDRIAKALSKAAVAQKRKAVVHLKVDTGLSRYGCLPSELVGVYRSVASLENVVVEGAATHFIDSSTNPERTLEQMRLFEETLAECRTQGIQFPLTHMANSAGVSLYPESQRDLVRVGAAAYGIDFSGAFDSQLKPVMHWRTRVLSVRERSSGTTISYNATHSLKRSSKIATLGIGYGDGYPRELSNKGVVYLRGQEAPIVGLVAMDQMMVDVTDVPGVEIGDEVELMGNKIRVEKLARLASEVPNPRELTLRVMSRVPRKYLY
jgi:alanine racemase